MMFWRRLTTIQYTYDDQSDQSRARNLIYLALGVFVAALLVVFVQVLDFFFSEDLDLLEYMSSLNRIMVLVLALFSFGNAALVARFVNAGQLQRASVLMVIGLFGIALLGFSPNNFNDGTLLAFSLPITAAGVLLDRNRLIMAIVGAVLILLAMMIMNDLGWLTEFSRGRLSHIEVVGIGGIIFGVNGLIMRAFSGRQEELLRENVVLNRSLERLVQTEQDSKAALESVVAAYKTYALTVAEGDLSRTLAVEEPALAQSNDLQMLGGSINTIVTGLNEMVRQVQQSSQAVSSAVGEILAASNEQIASATEQEAVVVQTLATVEEVQAIVKQTAERASAVETASQQTTTLLNQGQSAVQGAVAGMFSIQERVTEIATTILALSERTQQIGEIINTVNEIADQSKLLALNASIEAARAGEEGRGFAVVAMEVRQLAEQSRQATSRVADILNEIQQATNTAVMVTEEGSKATDAGVDLVEQAGAVIEEMGQSMESAAQAATQIAASTHQQTNGMDQLAGAIQSIRQATAQTAASTQQAERSAQDLNTMAEQMETVVAQYQL
jgi:methyl-accepting chemotaxis protein